MNRTILTMNDKETLVSQSIHQEAKSIWLKDFGHAGDVLRKYNTFQNLLAYNPIADELTAIGVSNSTVELLARICPEQF